MKIFGAVVCGIGLVLSGLFARAELRDMVVEGYKFSRPESWCWQPPVGPGWTALNRILVPDKNGNVHTDVRFYRVVAGKVESRERGLDSFKKGAKAEQTSTTVEKLSLTYHTITGETAATKKEKSHKNYRLVCVEVPGVVDKKNALFVRLLGPKSEVDAATAAFRQMVEDAVRAKTR